MLIILIIQMCTRISYLKPRRDYYFKDTDEAWAITRNKFTDDIIQQF